MAEKKSQKERGLRQVVRGPGLTSIDPEIIRLAVELVLAEERLVAAKAREPSDRRRPSLTAIRRFVRANFDGHPSKPRLTKREVDKIAYRVLETRVVESFDGKVAGPNLAIAALMKPGSSWA